MVYDKCLDCEYMYTEGDMDKWIFKTKKLEEEKKEFIEWLENWLKILKEQFKGMRGVNAAYQKLIIDTVNETLSKYKEIIGGDNK